MVKLMRIKQIKVKNLFGLFNHTIPFNLKEKITIIHGPNGLGKTIILKFIDGLFNRKYGIFYDIPFNEFEIEFENGDLISLIKKDLSDGNELILKINGKSYKNPFKLINLKKIGFPLRVLEDILPVTRIGADIWIWKPNNERLSLNEMFSRFRDQIINYLPNSMKEELNLIENKELQEFQKNLTVHLIETQRLLKIPEEKTRGYRSHKDDYPLVAVVKEYSEELTFNIESLLARFGELSQSLDRTFPVRLMKTKPSEILTKEKLQRALNQLEVERQKLRNLGLLGKVEDDLQIQEIDEDSEKVISLFVKDNEEKLSIFDEMAKKIDLLKKIINDHFLFKELYIDKQSGFVFESKNKQVIDPSDLSSGEQHELVLLYRLLFKIEPNSLILIDEPEISLHVAWQKRFLNDIQSISDIKDLNILIATHSPQIINEKWDWTVKLKGTN